MDAWCLDSKMLFLLNLLVFFREAKNQLRDLLIAAGFPEECLVPQIYNFTGPDPKLDLITALIAMGKSCTWTNSSDTFRLIS